MFNYKWAIKDGYPAKHVKQHNSTVFSTFACGGGSTMGYKLAGFDVVGANDIDTKMEKVYKKNHKPKHYILADIRKLLDVDLPKEFYNLDVLDGSPPCSTFSMSGSREKSWGKEKTFREGQSKQVLDDLFFPFIELAKLIQPKVVIAENVKGILLGNAKGYVIEIKKRFQEAGYNCQIFLLNAASMGVPQRRERVFFLCSRKDLSLPSIKLTFTEKPILFRDVDDGNTIVENKVQPSDLIYYDKCKPGNVISTVHPKGNRFNSIRLSYNSTPNTVTAGSCLYHPKYKRGLNTHELQLISSFPEDYQFMEIRPIYIMGMSVPPVMMAQVANQVYIQWLSKVQAKV